MASALVLVVVFVFDLIAFALAVAAEQRRAKATVRDDVGGSYCAYSSDIATGFGVGSLLFLLASQLLVMAVTRCLCCGRALRPGRSRSMAVVLFVTFWVFFLIAEACLLAGSVRNAYHTKYRSSIFLDNPPSCETLRKGVFGAGAAFVVLTGIASEFYYVYHSKANEGHLPPARDTGIGMGNYR